MKHLKNFSEASKEHPLWTSTFKEPFKPEDDMSEIELTPNIGKCIKFKPDTKDDIRMGYLASNLPYKILSIQKIYDDSTAYRVYNQLDRFGRPASPVDIEKIYSTEEEVRKAWEKGAKILMRKHNYKCPPFDYNFDDKEIDY